jgi:hypothetical protein
VTGQGSAVRAEAEAEKSGTALETGRAAAVAVAWSGVEPPFENGGGTVCGRRPAGACRESCITRLVRKTRRLLAFGSPFEERTGGRVGLLRFRAAGALASLAAAACMSRRSQSVDCVPVSVSRSIPCFRTVRIGV